MNSLNTLETVVRKYLEKEPKTRNSDNILYYRICQDIAKSKGYDFSHFTPADILLGYKHYGFPLITTVSRCRRKLQEDNEELRAEDSIRAFRDEKEAEYLAYVRGHKESFSQVFDN